MSRIGNAKIVMIKAGGGGMPADPLPIANGGTGNTDGYIRTGLESGVTAGTASTAEGDGNSSIGDYSHAEGGNNGVSGLYSHVEGYGNTVSGNAAHAEGQNNTVGDNALNAHVGGFSNSANYSNQTVVGKYNSNKLGTLFEVGNGTGLAERSNAFEVYSDGKFSQDNGSTKFKFGNNGTSDGYYDASGTFHAFGGASSSYPETVITVGTGMDYTSLKDALDSITDNSRQKPYCVLIKRGTYDCPSSDVAFGMKNYVRIVGEDKYKCIVRNLYSSSVYDSSRNTFDNYYPYEETIEYASIENLTVISQGCKGPIHLDSSLQDGLIEVKNCILYDLNTIDMTNLPVRSGNYNAGGVNCGICGGSEIRVYDTVSNGTIYAHNWPSQTEPMRFLVKNCSMQSTMWGDQGSGQEDVAEYDDCHCDDFYFQCFPGITSTKIQTIIKNGHFKTITSIGSDWTDGDGFAGWNQVNNGTPCVIDNSIHVTAYNDSASSISAGDLVQFSAIRGVDKNGSHVVPYNGGSIIGYAMEDIASGSFGVVQYSGDVEIPLISNINVGDEIEYSNGSYAKKSAGKTVGTYVGSGPYYRYKMRLGGSASSGGIYGVEWDGSSSSAMTRTDDAASFTDPNPYYSGMSDTPGSPFDNLMPWSGIRRITDATCGELVEIPRFYYKWTRTGANMKLQISPVPRDGFLVSPAHANRGDGAGSREYIYVGRYQCASDYKSKTGVNPYCGQTRATFRSNISALGADVWLEDFATFWTIAMLYLVEYADWDIQSKIGYGCGNNSSLQNTGASDSMPYHTGSMQTSRSAYGVGCQYRHIEGLWDNAICWIDGIYFSGTNVYCINNPSNFSDSTGGTLVGTRATLSAFIKEFTDPTAHGFEHALYVKTTYPGDPAYTYNGSGYNANGVTLRAGGSYFQGRGNGILNMSGDCTAADTKVNTSGRIMVLPLNRLA